MKDFYDQDVHLVLLGNKKLPQQSRWVLLQDTVEIDIIQHSLSH